MKDNSYFFYILCFLSFSLYAELPPVVTYISPRSQSVNVARDLVGWEHFTHLDTNCFYSVWDIAPEVSHSFRPERITQCFFGHHTVCCKCSITVSGSRTSDRCRTDLLADYFGLPTDFVSMVQFKPSITDAFLNFGSFIGFNNICKGLYAIIHFPVVYTRWDLNMCEDVIETGTNGYDTGYFNPTGAKRLDLLGSFIGFATGKQVPSIEGLTFQNLANAKMHCDALKETHLAEFHLALGYDFFLSDWYHFGLNIRTAIPAGNRPKGVFLFEPIVGNGHHWEAGIGISGHWLFYCNEEKNEEAGIYVDTNITHQFATCQRRSFDLKNKPLSRYMLAEKITPPITNNLRGEKSGILIPPSAQFQQEVAPVANFTTLDINVSAGVQADFAIALMYSTYPWSWMFGFGVWARSCEKINLCSAPFNKKNWALKGDTHVFGFEASPNNPAIALSATQSQATINAGKNFPSLGIVNETDIIQGKQNPGIDNPAPAFSDSNNDNIFDEDHSEPGGTNQINTSIEPIFLCNCDIDLNSAPNHNVVNKLFGQFTYEWDRCYGIPYIGFGAHVEFGGTADPSPPNQIGDCFNCAFSQWSIWLKGGITFE